MKKEDIIVWVMLSVIFLAGVFTGRTLFPEEVSEQRMKKECEDLGGKLDIGYDVSPSKGYYLTFKCVSPGKILWEK